MGTGSESYERLTKRSLDYFAKSAAMLIEEAALDGIYGFAVFIHYDPVTDRTDYRARYHGDKFSIAGVLSQIAPTEDVGEED